MWYCRRWFEWSIADISYCSVNHRRCYGDAFPCVFYSFSLPSNTPTERTWSLLHAWSHLAAKRYVVPHKISPPFICLHVHHHDIVKTSTLRPRRIPDICLLHAEGSPTIADSNSTSSTVSRCSAELVIPESSPMHHRIFGKMSVILPSIFPLCVFSWDVAHRHWSPPAHVCFIASTSSDILTLVGPYMIMLLD